MYLKISGGNNKGSAEQLFSYLTKENEIEGKSDDFFNANLLTGENYADFRNSVHTLEEYKTERDQLFFKNHKMSDFINDFDKHSAKSIEKKSSKFYMITINPSHKELCNLIGLQPEEVRGRHDLTQEQKKLLEHRLKCYTNDVMAKYAQSYGRPEISSEKDLLYYAKIEHSRIYRHYHPDVIDGKKRCGDEKEGLNYHVHVVVSRKSANGKVKLSPLNNNTSKKRENVSWENDGRKMQRGFKMESFQKDSINEFYNCYYYQKSSKFNAFEKQEANINSGMVNDGSGMINIVREPLKMLQRQAGLDVKAELKKQLVSQDQRQLINFTKSSVMAVVNVVKAAAMPTPVNIIKAIASPAKVANQASQMKDYESGT